MRSARKCALSFGRVPILKESVAAREATTSKEPDQERIQKSQRAAPPSHHSRESGNLGRKGRSGRPGWPNIPLSALGGEEGRGEVGDPRRSEQRRHPPHPPVAVAPGPSLSPRKRAERGKTFAKDRCQPKCVHALALSRGDDKLINSLRRRDLFGSDYQDRGGALRDPHPRRVEVMALAASRHCRSNRRLPLAQV
jgi:hypothetical protein